MKTAPRYPAILFVVLLGFTAVLVTSCASTEVLLEENPHSSGDLHALRQGQVLYNFHCAGCHGQGAEGDGPEQLGMGATPPSLIQFVQDKSDQQIAARIMSGSFSGMPSHRSQLNKEELWDIVHFLSSLRAPAH